MKTPETSIYSTSINSEVGTAKAFGDVPAAYGTLIDVANDKFHTTLEIYNETDADITIKFAQTGIEKVIFAGVALVRYPFVHNGIIQYKYTSGAPTSGGLMVSSW